MDLSLLLDRGNNHKMSKRVQEQWRQQEEVTGVWILPVIPYGRLLQDKSLNARDQLLGESLSFPSLSGHTLGPLPSLPVTAQGWK